MTNDPKRLADCLTDLIGRLANPSDVNTAGVYADQLDAKPTPEWIVKAQLFLERHGCTCADSDKA